MGQENSVEWIKIRSFEQRAKRERVGK